MKSQLRTRETLQPEVRTVHEYGGVDYMVDKGTVYFSNFKDQRLYRTEGLAPLPSRSHQAALT